MSKQSPERLEYLRNYRKNHKEQQRKYQKKYIDKLRQQGKYPISTSMKLRNEIQDLKQELQRKDNIIKELKNGIKKLDDMFYETFRISQDGYFSISEWELKDFTDKIKELESK